MADFVVKALEADLDFSGVTVGFSALRPKPFFFAAAASPSFPPSVPLPPVGLDEPATPAEPSATAAMEPIGTGGISRRWPPSRASSGLATSCS
jgi:hypothetical protein